MRNVINYNTKATYMLDKNILVTEKVDTEHVTHCLIFI